MKPQTSTARWSLALILLAACSSTSDEDPGHDATGASGSNAVGAGAGSSMSSASGGAESGTGGVGTGASSGTGGSGAGERGPNVDLSDPQLYEFELDPHVLDPSTVDSLEIQYAQLDTRTTPVGKLVVFLSGATNTPGDWKQHGRKLAEFGFHVLLPHYNNRWSSGQDLCAGMGGSCALDTRWEALVGEDTSSVVDISRADSAEGRVVTMIKHLTTAHVGGDWGYYLNADDSLRYEHMVIAGISHGAASTGLYAIRTPFSRAVMHSSGPAGDPSENKQTPLSEWYAFAHTEDPAYDPIVSSWANFGLLGALTSIDGSAPPYGDTHQLITSAGTTYPHCSVAVHDSSPINGNAYVFEPAWRYMYGVAP
jgi:dienelactone hydrolase